MLKRVKVAINELGYVGNSAARQLRVGQSSVLGLIVSNATNPVFAELAAGANEEAARLGKFVLLANSGEDPKSERDFIRFFESQQVGGILIVPIGEVPDELLALRSRGTPFVLIGAPSKTDGYPWISGDDEQGGFIAAQHLLAQGRRRIAFVGGSHHHVAARYAGARRAIEKHGRQATLEFISVPQQSAKVGEKVGKSLLAKDNAAFPDGIFAGNDLLALGILHTLIGAGVKVPEDVSLIGYDDIEFADFSIVPLTTIRHPSFRLGAAAVRLLTETGVNSFDQQAVPRFAPELIIRRTSLLSVIAE